MKNEIINDIKNSIDNLEYNNLKELAYVLLNNVKKDNLVLIQSYLNKDNSFKKRIDDLKGVFAKINNNEMSFNGTYYESYDYDYDFFEHSGWEYEDNDGICKYLKKAYTLAKELIMCEKYNDALEVLKLIVDSTYYSYVEDYGEYFDLSIYDLKDIINIDFNELGLNLIYTIYQLDRNNYKEIYKYLSKELFKYISVLDIKYCGSREPLELDKFLDNWINYLLLINDESSDYLLLEALKENKYKNYEICIDKIAHNQPKELIVIFNYLEDKGRTNEIKSIGLKLINKIDKPVEKRELCSYLMNIDVKNKDKYLYESYKECHYIMDLIKLLNLTDKYNNDLKELINRLEDTKDKFYLNVILGNISNDKIKNRYEAMLLLSLVLTNENKNSKILYKMLCNKELSNDINEDVDAFIKWKKDNPINNYYKDIIISNLVNYIDDYLTYVIKNQVRYEYDYCAFIVVLLEEFSQDSKYYEKYKIMSKNRQTFITSIRKYKDNRSIYE